MCKFVSGFLSRNGEIYCIPEWSDSHAEISKILNLRDDDSAWYHENLAKWECTPPADTKLWCDFSKWAMAIDEQEKPSWFDEDASEKVRDHVAKIVAPMFVHDKRGTLLGGCWIFDGAEASCDRIVRGKVVAVINGAHLAGANLDGAYLAGAKILLPAGWEINESWIAVRAKP